MPPIRRDSTARSQSYHRDSRDGSTTVVEPGSWHAAILGMLACPQLCTETRLSTALLGRHRQNHNISRFPECFETRERSLFAWPRFYRPLHPRRGYRLYPVGPTDLPDLEGIHSGQYGTRLV